MDTPHPQGLPQAHVPANPPLFAPRPATLALASTLFFVLLWSALPALLQTVPHADNIEQFNWAHALQWGYLKHPPLPTWLLHAGIYVFGPSAYLSYALAMGCVGVTLLLLWRCGTLLLAPGAALLVLLLSSVDYYLMGRGSFLNHNTVMLPFVAASAWAVLRIVTQTRQGAGDGPGAVGAIEGPGAGAGAGASLPWIVLGLAQGLGMLTKYQMALVITANALALLACGAHRRPGFVRHAGLASVCTLAPLLPHLAWLRTHDFSTFAYAGHSLLADLPVAERLRHGLGFTVQQLGRLAPCLIAVGLALLAARLGAGRRAGRNTPVPAPSHAPISPPTSPPMAAPLTTSPPSPASSVAASARSPLSQGGRALLLLALTPLCLVLALALLAGVAPQNHWGASTTLLLPLLAVVRWPRVRQLAVPGALTAVLAVHALAAGWNIVVARTSPGFHHAYAAQPLAALAAAHWQAHTAGEIRAVIGPDWDAGAIALELPTHPAVMGSGDRAQAPWITDALLHDCGALVLWRSDQPLEQQIGPELAARVTIPVHLETRVPAGRRSQMEAGLIAPQGEGCRGSASAPGDTTPGNATAAAPSGAAHPLLQPGAP